MIVAKMAVDYDPGWWAGRSIKGNWKKRRYWCHCTVKGGGYLPRPTGSYTLGPLRLDVKVIEHGE